MVRRLPRGGPVRGALGRPRPIAGRYVLLEELGRGGCGAVHRARDVRNGEHLAVKIARAPSARDRLAHEWAHPVRHPHVLTPRGWAREGELALLALELVTGGTLRDLLARGALPERLLVLLLYQLLDALAGVHSAGVVHGDVKPANLLLRGGARPHLLLADFGVAGPVGWPAPVSGTPAFLAPERAAGAARHPSQDVYAAGLVARRSLAGSSPVLTLCDSMTRPEPDRRPSAAQAMRRLAELCPRGLVV